MNIGDLVKLKDGSVGIVTKIVSNDPMSRRFPWAQIDGKGKALLRDLKPVTISP
jgi:hypothetical protein